MPCGRGCLNRLEGSIKIDIINFCGMIEAPKVQGINKGIEFCLEDRVVCPSGLFDGI
jgi:hypothetical protein